MRAVLRRSTGALRLLLVVLIIMTVALLPLAAHAGDDDGPIVGMPPPQDLVTGRAMDIWSNPDYWEHYLREAILQGHVNVPWPMDPVKPEAFLPNVPVAHGAYVSSLDSRPIDLSDVTYEWQGNTKTIEQFLTTTQTDILLFVANGAIAAEYYTNGFSPSVRHQPWSVTKTFVAAAVGIGLEEGLIGSIHDPIDAYIPELVGTAWESVTIENLLQMQSGVHWDEDTPVLAVNTQVQQWLQVALDVWTDGALGMTRNEFLMSLPKVYEQGTEFRYNSGNTQVLAWLTEVVYGAPFNEIISDKLWQPMGAAGDAVMIADRVGGVIASQGLYARSHDFARFGELLRNGGRTPDGHQVVPEAWVDAMVTMTDVSNGRYGYQTWSHTIAGPDGYSASGFQGQKVTVLPHDCVTGVRLAHALGADLRDGDDPFDPDAYRFAVEFFSTEWQVMLRAVADEIGACATNSSPMAPAPDPDSSQVGDAAALPATGAGVGFLGFLMLLAAVRTRRS